MFVCVNINTIYSSMKSFSTPFQYYRNPNPIHDIQLTSFLSPRWRQLHLTPIPLLQEIRHLSYTGGVHELSPRSTQYLLDEGGASRDLHGDASQTRCDHGQHADPLRHPIRPVPAAEARVPGVQRHGPTPPVNHPSPSIATHQCTQRVVVLCIQSYYWQELKQWQGQSKYEYFILPLLIVIIGFY